MICAFLAYLAKRYGNKFLFYGRVSVASALFALVFLYNAGFFVYTAYLDSYSVIVKAAEHSPVGEERELGLFLKDNYDGGKILITRALHNAVPVHANIPLKNYIHESNFRYYDQALAEPWMFARYVVMFNPRSIENDPWRTDNEKITARWAYSKDFNELYDLVFENNSERLYKVNEETLLTYLSLIDVDAENVPSVNINLSTWDPEALHAYFDAHRIIPGSGVKVSLNAI